VRGRGRGACDPGDLGLLRRTTEFQNSTYRLGHLADDPLARKEFNTADARKWRETLGQACRRNASGWLGTDHS
jgi:hypothetical protein